MHLTLVPQAPSGLGARVETILAVAGDVLTFDGVAYDLSPVPEGGAGLPDGAPDEHPFIGPIRRSDGVIHAVLRVVLDTSAAPDQPDSPWIIPAASGSVMLPARRIGEPQ